MGWKATGHPTVRKQRDKWTVRVDGIDTETGKHRPHYLAEIGADRCGRKPPAHSARSGRGPTAPIGRYGVSFGAKTEQAPDPCGPGAAVVRVDQTTGATGATYGLTTMLTGVSLNLNDVTSLWLCPKVANGFVTEP